MADALRIVCAKLLGVGKQCLVSFHHMREFFVSGMGGGLPLGSVSASPVHRVPNSSTEDCHSDSHRNRVSFCFFGTGVIVSSVLKASLFSIVNK